MTRSVRGAGRRVTANNRPGARSVLIDDLVSPLRYDVLVREQFFAFLLGTERRPDPTAQAFLDDPAARAYFVWFRDVVVRRFMPRIIGDEGAIRAAFADRVAAATDLARSFEADGYDPSRPITLFSGRRLLPTSTGKRIARRTFAGDGCHRLALLRLNGSTELEPDQYRVNLAWRYRPPDNTAALLPALGVETVDYIRFLALSYAPGSRARTEAELLEDASRWRPERLDELRSVLEADAPIPAATN